MTLEWWFAIPICIGLIAFMVGVIVSMKDKNDL